MTEADINRTILAVWRIEQPRLLTSLSRMLRDVPLAEDLTQEALLAAIEHWPATGVPEKPGAWLMAIARRRALDQLRRGQMLARKHAIVARDMELEQQAMPDWDAALDDDIGDELLRLIFTACHPRLSREARAALALRMICGLTTAEIARAFLVPEATMAQRISRAKQRIKASGTGFRLPSQPERSDRLPIVLQVLYLIFNEGYTASSGPGVHRAELTVEAIRLTRAVHTLLPHDGEVTGLLALMLLTDARRPARTLPDGRLVPLDEQDRSRWDAEAISEGAALVSQALASAPLGPYQVQGAIAAIHDEAARPQDTDWRQILALYGLLERLAPGPAVTLNRAVAVAMVQGPRAGLEALSTLDGDGRIARGHRAEAVRAHLLELAGDRGEARTAFTRAARRTTSLPEQRYLQAQAARLTPRDR